MAWQSMGLNLVLMSNELVQEAARMQRFPPDTMVTAAVTFSRCLYAQLVQQAVQAPDSVSAPSQQLPGFKPPDGFPLPATGSPSRKAAELGMKLTAGMEIMCSAKARAERGVSPPVRAACRVKSSATLRMVHEHGSPQAWPCTAVSVLVDDVPCRFLAHLAAVCISLQSTWVK